MLLPQEPNRRRRAQMGGSKRIDVYASPTQESAVYGQLLATASRLDVDEYLLDNGLAEK